ncbi:hypothetical protein LINPERPRIM_LOCUS25949 [Linum perenne]
MSITRSRHRSTSTFRPFYFNCFTARSNWMLPDFSRRPLD